MLFTIQTRPLDDRPQPKQNLMLNAQGLSRVSAAQHSPRELIRQSLGITQRDYTVFETLDTKLVGAMCLTV
jgi:hypothetical protein